MTQLVKLEKRFEIALEKIEQALAKKNLGEASGSIGKKDKDEEKKSHNIDDLLIRIGKLEKAAKSDAEEIDRLVMKLKEILEMNISLDNKDIPFSLNSEPAPPPPPRVISLPPLPRLATPISRLFVDETKSITTSKPPSDASIKASCASLVFASTQISAPCSRQA